MKTLVRVFLCALLFSPQLMMAFPADAPFGAAFTADKTEGCISLSVTFTDQSVPPLSDPIVSWKWYFGDGTESTDQSPTHVYSSEGIYTVKLEIITQSSWSDALTKTDYIQAGALSLNLGKDTAICDASSLMLDAGNPGASYLWSTGEATQTIAVASEGAFDVVVTRYGCVKKDTININFRPAASPNFGFVINSNCLPAEVQFFDSSIACPGYSITGRLWQFGDGTTSTEQNPVHLYTTGALFNVKLSITDNIGTTLTKPKKVNILNIPAPVVNLGADTLICVGSSITLDATNAGAAYLWSNGDTQPTLETYFPGEYSVEVTLSGCVRKDTIVVDNGPILFADFSVVQSGICLPVSAAFTEFSQTCNGSVVEWKWDFGDGTFSTDPNPTHLFASSGTFAVSLTVKNSIGVSYTANQDVIISAPGSPSVELGADTTVCEGVELFLNAENAGATYSWSTGESTPVISVYDPGKYTVTVEMGGCSVTDSINVTIVNALTVDFSNVKLTGCLPVKMKFTDNSTTCSGSIVQWAWSFGDGTTSALQNPEHSFPASGQFNVKLKVTNSSGVAISKTKKITIVPLTVSVSLGADTAICFGSVLNLDAANPGADYLWSTGETSRVVGIADDGEYHVKVSIDGCEARDTIKVTVANSAKNSWGYHITSACLPVITNFTDSSIAFCGQSLTGWKWDFGDGVISLEQNPSHAYLRSDSFVVRLSVTTSGGLTISKSKKIFIANTIPHMSMTEEIQVCRNVPVQLDAGLTDAQYKWSPSIGLNADDIRNPLLSPYTNGYYKVDVIKCGVQISDSLFIRLDSSAGKPEIVHEGNFLKASDALGYQWYRDGKIISGETSKVFRVDSKGYYSIKISNHSGCENESDSLFVIPFSGKEKPVDGITVKCSPNPTQGLVNVLLSEIPKRPVIVSIVDENGIRLYTTTIANHVNPLNLTKLAKGMYFMELIINMKKKVLPLVIF